ncbi:HDOD domain-containing protein [Rhodocyclaceae bacterium SMB388]
MTMLDSPLASADDHVAFLSAQHIPVLRRTVRALDALRDEQDSVNARRIAAAVLADPLMTVKVLAHLQANRRDAQNHDITTMDRAIMMMGIAPFLNAFSGMETLEDRLASHPKALLGALQVITRARRAAQYARDWAILRHDMDANEITVAALLHETAEILCWTFAPEPCLRIQRMQQRDPRLRSDIAQRTILGATFNGIQLGLARAWKLPELLLRLLDEADRDNPRVRNVLLANRFTRHVARGWDDPALPDDIVELEKLLRIAREPLLQRLGVPQDQRARFLPEDEALP